MATCIPCTLHIGCWESAWKVTSWLCGSNQLSYRNSSDYFKFPEVISKTPLQGKKILNHEGLRSSANVPQHQAWVDGRKRLCREDSFLLSSQGERNYFLKWHEPLLLCSSWSKGGTRDLGPKTQEKDSALFSSLWQVKASISIIQFHTV